MTRLCKHWGHKFPVTLNEQKSEIVLPMGICRMLYPGNGLTVEPEGNAEQMSTFQQVVSDHLQRMAGKDDLVIEWQ